MSKIQTMINKLDKELSKATTEYNDLHLELDKHRGKPLEETDLLLVNKLIKDIQDKYAELYPAAYWIAHRIEYACNISKSHQDFVDSLIRAGSNLEDKK